MEINLRGPKDLTYREGGETCSSVLGDFSDPGGVLGEEVVVLTHGGCLELPDSLRQGDFN